MQHRVLVDAAVHGAGFDPHDKIHLVPRGRGRPRDVAGRMAGLVSGTSAFPAAGLYMYCTTVGAEQSASNGAPSRLPCGSRKLCVWQMNGSWCGPEVIGPVTG